MMDLSKYTSGEELFDGHYKMLRPLSTDGATADVWLAIDVNTIDSEPSEDPTEKNVETGMMVAIKIYRPKNALDIEGEQRFRDEFKIVYELRHANLLQPTGFSIFGEYPYLVLPYCKSGSSERLIGKQLSEDDIWKFILDVASGLNRLHSNNPQIIHQDIKPANILLDNSGNFAITDFGISSRKGGTHGYYYDDGNSGTLACMAPERFFDGADPLPQSDIWAFGASLYEILSGKVPFGEDGGSNQTENNATAAPIPSVSADINRLLQACLDKEPGNRPSAQDLMDAARVKKYPVSKRSNKLGIVLVLMVLVSWLTAWMFIPERVEIEHLTDQQLYDIAVSKLASDDPEVYNTGYVSLDSLSRLEYVPAMYQMAFIHGWYSDSESLRLKDKFGIKYESKLHEYYPESDNDNQKAIIFLQQILEKSDTSFPVINAQAAYRLAGYYINDKMLKRDFGKGRELLESSRDWASRAGETEMVKKIDLNLSRLKKY